MTKEKKTEDKQDSIRLSKRAKRFLDGIQGGMRQTKPSWSEFLYGDTEHQGNINGLMRYIRRKTGIVIAPVPDDPKAFPPEAGYLKIIGAGSKESDVSYVNKKASKDMMTRFDGYSALALSVVVSFPELTPIVQQKVEDILLRVLETKQFVIPTYVAQLSSRDGIGRETPARPDATA